MKFSEKTIGNGITVRTTGGFDSEEFNENIKRYNGIFGAAYAHVRDECRLIIDKHQAKHPEDAFETYQEDSPHYFAHEILNLLQFADNAIEAGNPDEAARRAMGAGILWGMVVVKWEWELDALRGEKVAGGAKNSAHQKNEKHKSLRERRREAIDELIPEIGLDNAARVVALRPELANGADWEALKKQYNRHKNRDT